MQVERCWWVNPIKEHQEAAGLGLCRTLKANWCMALGLGERTEPHDWENRKRCAVTEAEHSDLILSDELQVHTSHNDFQKDGEFNLMS